MSTGEVVAAAQRAEQIVNSTPSFRAQEQQAGTSAKETIARTIQVMKEARDRIGDFFVMVGEGKNEALILSSPIMRTVRWGDGREDTLHTYVLFHETGIREINFVQRSTASWFMVPERLTEERSEELAFAKALEEIARSGPEKESSPGHTLGYSEHIPSGKSEPDNRTLTIKTKHQIISIHHARHQHAITDLTNTAVVVKALEASIAGVQLTHQKGIESAKATIAVTEVVNQKLGVKEPSPTHPVWNK